MAAQRCTLCGIDYPDEARFKTCPVHEEPTSYHHDLEPDPDYRERAERLYAQLMAEQVTGPYPRVTGVTITEEEIDGKPRLLVRHWDLLKAGYRPQMTGSFHVFELDGILYETQGWWESRRSWWIERLGPAIELAEELPVVG